MPSTLAIIALVLLLPFENESPTERKDQGPMPRGLAFPPILAAFVSMHRLRMVAFSVEAATADDGSRLAKPMTEAGRAMVWEKLWRPENPREGVGPDEGRIAGL